jgi:hypothetical protein
VQWGTGNIQVSGYTDSRSYSIGYGGSFSYGSLTTWWEGDIFGKTFPIPFPHACSSILTTTKRYRMGTFDEKYADYSSSPGAVGELRSNSSDSDFRIVDYTEDGFRYTIDGSAGHPIQMHFLAIGY